MSKQIKHKQRANLKRCEYCTGVVNSQEVIHKKCIRDYLKKNGFIMLDIMILPWDKIQDLANL